MNVLSEMMRDFSTVVVFYILVSKNVTGDLCFPRIRRFLRCIVNFFFYTFFGTLIISQKIIC